MIFDFLKKQTNINSKKELTKVMILNLNINEEQKSLYIQAIDILDDSEIEQLYRNWSNYVNNLELKEIDEIRKNSFIEINWLRKKEAREKKKEINSFNFLFNNI